MALSRRIALNDGTVIPILGLGVYQSEPGAETKNAVIAALKNGYRHIDTAAYYRNEEDVGEAIRASGVPREQIFVTTKLWMNEFGYDKTIEACKTSLKKLGFDYIDLYLVHAPPRSKSARENTWRAMEKLKDDGLVKSIGVSNYGVHHLEELLANCRIKPSVNQIELHPYLLRKELVNYCQKHDIVVQAYSPLTRGQKLKDPKLVEIAKKYDKTTAQLLIRWCIQKGYIVIPKSVKEERIIQNADVFDWEISEDDMKRLDGFDCDLHTTWDPTTQPL